MDEFLKNHPDVEVIGIDEVQFFGSDVVEFCEKYVNLGKRLIVAGLDMDFRGEPFDPMPKLMSIADYVDKFHAICTICGNPSYVSQRIINGEPAYYDDSVVLVGADESYEARCRRHHIVKYRNKKESKLYFIVGTDMGVGKEEVENIYFNELQNNSKYEAIKIKEDMGSESKIDELRKKIIDKMNVNDVVFVRIIGGILLPLNGKYNILDLIREFRKESEVILVANNKKGIMNHILLINEILSNSNINVKEIVYTKNLDIEIENEEIFNQIREITNINYRQI